MFHSHCFFSSRWQSRTAFLEDLLFLYQSVSVSISSFSKCVMYFCVSHHSTSPLIMSIPFHALFPPCTLDLQEISPCNCKHFCQLTYSLKSTAEWEMPALYCCVWRIVTALTALSQRSGEGLTALHSSQWLKGPDDFWKCQFFSSKKLHKGEKKRGFLKSCGHMSSGILIYSDISPSSPYSFNSSFSSSFSFSFFLSYFFSNFQVATSTHFITHFKYSSANK